MARTPSVVHRAQRLIVWEVGVLIADRRISFELTTEPNQYRVHYSRRKWRRGRIDHSLVPTLTITPGDFSHWQHWHVAGFADRTRKNKGVRP
jgi:hypothetical protein